MKFVFHRKFVKQYRDLRKGEQVRLKERLAVFADNPHHAILNNHMLHGAYVDHRSINVGGDLRAVYYLESKDMAVFVAIGKHSALYE